MRGIPPALQIAAENFSPVDVARGESGELSKDEHRRSKRTPARSTISMMISNYLSLGTRRGAY